MSTVKTGAMLELKKVSKTFNAGTPDSKKALDNLDLSVQKGDFITIIGANGAGKSSLFNAICGTFLTDSGSIILDGKDITFLADHKRAKSIGRLFQDPMMGSAPGMTIEENLALAAGRGGWLSRISKAERQDFRDRLAVLDLGLEDKMGSRVGQLSGGQRQALTLLMATMVTPKLLMLDEHTAALDPGTAAKVLALTDQIIKERHISCLMVTHNMNQALEMGNRTIMMSDGRIVFDVSGSERENMTVGDLLEHFAAGAGRQFNNDRILLSTRQEC